jgi:hypothetical protein
MRSKNRHLRPLSRSGPGPRRTPMTPVSCAFAALPGPQESCRRDERWLIGDLRQILTATLLAVLGDRPTGTCNGSLPAVRSGQRASEEVPWMVRQSLPVVSLNFGVRGVRPLSRARRTGRPAGRRVRPGPRRSRLLAAAGHRHRTGGRIIGKAARVRRRFRPEARRRFLAGIDDAEPARPGLTFNERISEQERLVELSAE